jgi:glycosyltransferase involved in cell wall biosynthesis
MSRFPTVTETFVLNEILEMQRFGISIEIFPLIKQDNPILHPQTPSLLSRVHGSRLFSLEMLSAQLYWVWKRPVAYLGAWWKAVFGNIASPKFLSRSFVVVPKAALFARQMMELRVHHIHAHWATHPALAAYTIHQLTRIPYSFTTHAHDLFVERTMLKQKIRKASFVVTISDYNKEFLKTLYGEDASGKTFVIHCGIDPAMFKPVPITTSDCFKIICVAALRDFKGHTYLLDACAELKSRGVNYVCILVGDGPVRRSLESKVASLGLKQQVRFAGWKPQNEVAELMAGSDVMVLPSITTPRGKQDGIPVALMEAMALQRPVIATGISGIPELVVQNDTGLIVPERDSFALAEAMLLLYGNPRLAARLAKNGCEKVLKDFNLHRNAEALRTLLEQNYDALPANGYQRAAAAYLKKEGAMK